MTSVRTRDSWIALIASIGLVSVAQILLKLAATQVPELSWHWSWVATCATLPVLLPLCTGLICYLISLLCWLKVLEQLPLARAYPLLSLSYPLVYAGANLLPNLHEASGINRIVGMALIMLGIVLLAPSAAASESTQ